MSDQRNSTPSDEVAIGQHAADPGDLVAIGGVAFHARTEPTNQIVIGREAIATHDEAIVIGSRGRSTGPRTLTIAWGEEAWLEGEPMTAQVVIHADGRVDLPSGVEPTEVARRFWKVLGEANPALLWAQNLEQENNELRGRLQRILWIVEKGLVGRAEPDSVGRLASVDRRKEASQ